MSDIKSDIKRIKDAEEAADSMLKKTARDSELLVSETREISRKQEKDSIVYAQKKNEEEVNALHSSLEKWAEEERQKADSASSVMADKAMAKSGDMARRVVDKVLGG